MIQRITSKLAVSGALAAAIILATPMLAFAHVVVSPSQALTGAYETFTTSVPNEKDVAVTGLRLVIPETVESVMPTVKPGWNIETKKSGDKITEISWTGGTIEPGLRDEFTFSAHMPDESREINWKAYQTYADGSVVSWDQQPSDEHGHGSEDESKGPYSTTVVSDDAEGAETADDDSSSFLPYVISIAALTISVFTLVRVTRK